MTFPILQGFLALEKQKGWLYKLKLIRMDAFDV